MASAYHLSMSGQGHAALPIQTNLEALAGRAETEGGKYLRLLGTAPIVEDSAKVRKLQALLENPDVTRVSQLCDALELSHARTARFCKQVYGETPKAMLRKHRLSRMLEALDHRPYSEWRDFLCLSYYDQSHLIREFQHFLGMSPTQFLVSRGVHAS